MELTHDRMFEAIVKKDTAFEGVFFTAVKTTGIFCRPSCTARKPRIENVEFFKTSRECLLRGYRPCKVCQPLQHLHQTPEAYQQILAELTHQPATKLKDADLKQRGIEPSQIRRWFLKNHGLTFQAYQRMLRINTAAKKLQSGTTITSIAYDAGFESLSGFGESFKTLLGVSPKKGKAQTIIDLKRLETPLGTMLACASTEGICLLEFTDRKGLEGELKTIATLLNATVLQGHNQHIQLLEQQLEAYFTGTLTRFSVPLHTPGTPFQQKVWAALHNIPYGTTTTYLKQAIAIGSAASVRAVANANGANRVAILIPCHRVIGGNGQLTGYSGGLWRKQYLLDLEQQHRQ